MQQITINELPELDYHGNEAYKTLRTNIQFSGEAVKVIALTSCMPGDGKSSVSFRLAVSMTEIGKKVLFIDADMRKSVLMGRHRMSVKNAKGLAHYLAGQSSYGEVLSETSIPNLYMILSGLVPPNPSELLSGKLFTELLTKHRDEFDYIIIDTPPVGSVIDSAIIARACDGIALVISANAVSYKFAQRAKKQLEAAGCKLLGVVLNKVKITGRGYYGKYYGKYYGNYYADEKENDKHKKSKK